MIHVLIYESFPDEDTNAQMRARMNGILANARSYGVTHLSQIDVENNPDPKNLGALLNAKCAATVERFLDAREKAPA